MKKQAKEEKLKEKEQEVSKVVVKQNDLKPI